jgi:hypothetical protein
MSDANKDMLGDLFNRGLAVHREVLGTCVYRKRDPC